MKPNILVRNIHIGSIISQVILEKELSMDEIRLKMGITARTLNKYLDAKSMDCILLLKFSKVLRYDFFRLYSSHLMLHHGISNTFSKSKDKVNINGVHIRKNVYTKELIIYLVKKIRDGDMKVKDVIKSYGVPKTTFYKWLQKYP